MTDKRLRDELIAMAETDVSAVTDFYAQADDHRAAYESTRPAVTDTPWPYKLLEWSPPSSAPTLVRRVVDTVHANTARLRQIVEVHGWPGRSLVGEDGADAAWLLLQHAGSAVSTIGTPEHHAFRRSCVPLLRRAVSAGEAHPRHLAWTVDGIHAVTGRPPVYGVLAGDFTTVDGIPVLRAPVDVDALDRHRAQIGLPPLASDIARRVRGERLDAAGPDRAEPWPAR